MLDSDGFDETIIALILFLVSTEKILEAAPGPANNIPPVKSSNPTFLIADTHLTESLDLEVGNVI